MCLVHGGRVIQVTESYGFKLVKYHWPAFMFIYYFAWKEKGVIGLTLRSSVEFDECISFCCELF